MTCANEHESWDYTKTQRCRRSFVFRSPLKTENMMAEHQ